MKILAIIPARGGSKRIPKKNVKKLAGKPLIHYSIDAAKKSRLIDRIVVSTDNKLIAKIAINSGVEVIKRPPELATDKSPTEPTLAHVVDELEKLGYKPDLVVLLQPTSPFRKVEHIEEGIKLARNEHADLVVSLQKVKKPPTWMFEMKSGGAVKKFIELSTVNSNEYLNLHVLNGAIYVIKTEFLLSKQDIYSGRTYGFVMDNKSSLDIDDHEDFKLAKVLFDERD